jgi:bacteriocin biosynthesis cyclodehydratase domain-containing protein
MSAAGAGDPPRIGFKQHIRAEVSATEGAYLFSEHDTTVLQGTAVESVVALLDGTRDVAGVLASVPVGVSREKAAGVLAKLTAAGLISLRTGPGNGDSSAAAYWEAAGLDGGIAEVQTASSTVRLIALDGVDGDAAEGALRAAGLVVHTEGGVADADLTVVLCADYLDPALAGIDAEQRAAGRPWLPAKVVGTRVWIGPVFEPSTPGCWHCLAARLWDNRPAEKHAVTALGRCGPAPSPVVAIPPSTGAAAQLVAMEATKYLAGHRHPNQRAIWVLDTLDLTGTHHPRPVLPQCASCGDPDVLRARGHQPVELVSRPRVSHGGGYRAMTAEQTMTAYRHLVSPVTGVVKEVVRDPRGPDFFNAYRSGANAAAGSDLRTLRSTLRTCSGGKGMTAADAEVGALCEAVERYSATFRGDEALVRGSLLDLGEQAIHPNDVLLYDERQYRDRAQWNGAHSPFQWVCGSFSETAVGDWSPIWSLTEQRHRLLPTSLLYYGAPGSDVAAADSNGNAAGSSLEDAVLQGMLELIERDAVAIWWYNRLRVPGVDLDAFGDPWIDRLREVYAGIGRQVWVLDITTDTGVPTMAAVSRSTAGGTEDIVFGFGSHLDPGIALRRALTELNQMMPMLVERRADGGYSIDDPDTVHWWQTATLANQPYLSPDLAQPQRTPRDYPRHRAADLLDDVTAVQRKLEALGLEVLVLDQTRPDIGLPVVKVVVPGLRHFWARLGPGRLFDVPVRMGLRDTPTDYAELNPMPVFL